MTKTLFSPFEVGPFPVRNRIVMAPLTRSRSLQPGNYPGRMNAFYYAQRSGAGLIITEATQITQTGQGYLWTPGIHSSEQIEGWRLVAEAVHDAGGILFMQLWHVGRISHRFFQPDGAHPVAPSAIAAKGEAMILGADGAPVFVPLETPRALQEAEIPRLIQDYVQGARNALCAGLDGVEVHAANGYLIDQFLSSESNHRTDCYGGSIENRCRLLLEIIDQLATQMSSTRIGVRLSPLGTFNDMNDRDPEGLFAYLATALSPLDLAYVHLVDPTYGGHTPLTTPDSRGAKLVEAFRSRYRGRLILCGNYSLERAQAAISEDRADLIAFGKAFIANPDLAERFRENAALNEANPATFYGGGAQGYVDYPTLAQERGEEGPPDFSVLET